MVLLDDTVIGVRWGLLPHASSFKLKFTVSKTFNYTEFSSKCHLEIRPADLLDTLIYFLIGHSVWWPLFCHAGPTLWNSLPEQLRQLDITFGQFKRSLKTFLFG